MESFLNQTAGAENGEEENEDPFKRLPDELIISHICNKICEAESLCFCSMVSKHFSSLVFQTHNVSLKIPLQNDDEQPTNTTHSLSLPGKVLHFVTAPLRLVQGLFCSILPLQRSSTTSDSEFLSHIPIKFLAKFTSMRSLYLEYDNSGPGLISSKEEALIKWRIHPKISAFIVLCGRNLLDSSTDDDDNQDYECFVANEIGLLALHFDYHLEIAASRFSLLEKLVPLLPQSLQNVVVTDSKKQGKFDFGEDDVVGLRNGNINFENLKGRLRFWFAPLLILPSFCFALKTVSLLVCHDSEIHYDDFLIAKEAFDEEDEEVFVEAAMEMMKKEPVYETILSVED